jgi:hypothetical protein
MHEFARVRTQKVDIYVPKANQKSRVPVYGFSGFLSEQAR